MPGTLPPLPIYTGWRPDDVSRDGQSELYGFGPVQGRTQVGGGGASGPAPLRPKNI